MFEIISSFKTLFLPIFADFYIEPGIGGSGKYESNETTVILVFLLIFSIIALTIVAALIISKKAARNRTPKIMGSKPSKKDSYRSGKFMNGK